MCKFLLSLITILILSGNSWAAILIESTNGVLVSNAAYSTMAQACAQPSTVHITSALSSSFSNYSTAASCTPQIVFHPQGSLGNTTKFKFSTPPTITDDNQHFAGSGLITGLTTAKPQWWGGRPATISDLHDSYSAITAAKNSLVNTGILRLSTGVWLSSNSIIVTDPNGPSQTRNIVIAGDDQKTTWLFHYGNQSTGAIQISGQGGAAWASGFYIAQTGGSSVRDISVGSIGGPAIYLYATNKNVLTNVKFFSAAATSAYLLLGGAVENRYFSLDDWGNEYPPADVFAILTAAGGTVNPYNGISVIADSYNDGVHGAGPMATQEHWFIGTRMQPGGVSGSNSLGYMREAIKFTGNSGGALQEMKRFHFIGGKLTASHTYPVIYNNGAQFLYVTDCFSENFAGTYTNSSVILDNQLDNSDVTITASHDSSNTFLDLGAPAGGPYATTPGIYKMSMTVIGSQFGSLRNNYDTPYTQSLVLNDVGFNTLPNIGTAPPNYQILGSYLSNISTGLAPGFTPTKPSMSGTGSVVTVIQRDHGLHSGDTIKASGSDIAGYNVSTATVTVISPVSFTYPGTGTGTPSTSAPLVQKYEAVTYLPNQVGNTRLTLGTPTTRAMSVDTLGTNTFGQLNFSEEIGAGTPDNGSLYVNSTDHKLYYRGASGTVTSLANP